MLKNKNNIKILIAFLIILLPIFNSFFSSPIDSVPELNNQTLKFYQTNSCNISLGKFLLVNYENNSLEYLFQYKSDIPCFGKVFYVEPSGEKFIVLISLNPMVSMLLQSAAWLLLISIIKRSKNTYKKPSFIEMLFLIVLLMTHLLSEKEFYIMNNQNYTDTLQIDNYFLISYFLIFSFLVFYIVEICSSRLGNLLYYLPFIFLFQGTFIGTNLNIFAIILFLIGFKNIKNKNLLFYNVSFFLLLLITVTKNYSLYSYFDVDKLRGFSMSSNDLMAIIFWSLAILFITNGLHYMVAEIENFNYQKLVNNLLLSGFLLIVAGIFSTFNELFNKFSLIFFGLNKSSSESLSSVAGNSWRGISPSAEMIGEFYSIILLISFLLYKTSAIQYEKKSYIYVVFIFYGLLRSNNATAIISLSILIFLFLVNSNIKTVKIRRIIYLIFICISLISSYFLLRQNTYSNMSHVLANEALIVTGADNKLITEKDFITIFNDENSENISTSLKFIGKFLINDNKFESIPNIFSILSVLALFINRSEKWGIFFAKYDPNVLDFTFGYGALNLINYEFDNSINTPGLLLPHSSILSIMVFFGFLGLIVFLFVTIKKLYKNKNNLLVSLPVVFLLINFIKSDSLFYLPMFILFVTLFNLLDKKATTQ